MDWILRGYGSTVNTQDPVFFFSVKQNDVTFEETHFAFQHAFHPEIYLDLRRAFGLRECSEGTFFKGFPSLAAFQLAKLLISDC